jgi:hypothetical protein
MVLLDYLEKHDTGLGYGMVNLLILDTTPLMGPGACPIRFLGGPIPLICGHSFDGCPPM